MDNLKVTFDESKNELTLIAGTQEDRNLLLAFWETEIASLEVEEWEQSPNFAIKFKAVMNPKRLIFPESFNVPQKMAPKSSIP